MMQRLFVIKINWRLVNLPSDLQTNSYPTLEQDERGRLCVGRVLGFRSVKAE